MLVKIFFTKQFKARCMIYKDRSGQMSAPRGGNMQKGKVQTLMKLKNGVAKWAWCMQDRHHLNAYHFTNSPNLTSLTDKKIKQRCIWSPADGYEVDSNMYKLTRKTITNSSGILTESMLTVESKIRDVPVLDMLPIMLLITTTITIQVPGTFRHLKCSKEKQVRRLMANHSLKITGRKLFINLSQ